MSKSKEDPGIRPRDPKSPVAKIPYSKPELESLGRIRDLTRMPGGSINTEGSSGKPHRQ